MRKPYFVSEAKLPNRFFEKPKLRRVSKPGIKFISMARFSFKPVFPGRGGT